MIRYPYPTKTKSSFKRLSYFHSIFPNTTGQLIPLNLTETPPPLLAFGGLGSLETGGSAWPGGAGILRAEGVEEAPK